METNTIEVVGEVATVSAIEPLYFMLGLISALLLLNLLKGRYFV